MHFDEQCNIDELVTGYTKQLCDPVDNSINFLLPSLRLSEIHQPRQLSEQPCRNLTHFQSVWVVEICKMVRLSLMRMSTTYYGHMYGCVEVNPWTIYQQSQTEAHMNLLPYFPTCS
jgi:hypothetical protein